MAYPTFSWTCDEVHERQLTEHDRVLAGQPALLPQLLQHEQAEIRGNDDGKDDNNGNVVFILGKWWWSL